MGFDNRDFSGRKALITGIDGQDGFYLAHYLAQKGYVVVGLSRRAKESYSPPLFPGQKIVQGDVTDKGFMANLLSSFSPDEIYHFAGFSSVVNSRNYPDLCFKVNIGGIEAIICALLCLRGKRDVKLYNASTSEIFAPAVGELINENSHREARSPYASSKLVAHEMIEELRKTQGVYAVNGIAFNHESIRRPDSFLIKKIMASFLGFCGGKVTTLEIGNLDSIRDFGYAPEFVVAQWRLLQLSQPEDFILCTGQSMSIKQVIENFACCMGMQVHWDHASGAGEAEFVYDSCGKQSRSGKLEIAQSTMLIRRDEIKSIEGDPSRAKKRLQWETVYSGELLIKKLLEDHKFCHLRDELHN